MTNWNKTSLRIDRKNPSHHKYLSQRLTITRNQYNNEAEIASMTEVPGYKQMLATMGCEPRSSANTSQLPHAFPDEPTSCRHAHNLIVL